MHLGRPMSFGLSGLRPPSSRRVVAIHAGHWHWREGAVTSVERIRAAAIQSCRRPVHAGDGFVAAAYAPWQYRSHRRTLRTDSYLHFCLCPRRRALVVGFVVALIKVLRILILCHFNVSSQVGKSADESQMDIRGAFVTAVFALARVATSGHSSRNDQARTSSGSFPWPTTIARGQNLFA